MVFTRVAIVFLAKKIAIVRLIKKATYSKFGWLRFCGVMFLILE